MGLKTNALLIAVNISQWAGRKLDRRATNTVEVTHATQERVGNFTKKLLPGAQELEAIQASANAIRKYFYENTLPWAADGARIISSQNYLPFTTEFRARKQAFDSHVGNFLSQYPTLRENAKQKLGDLFSEAEYPEADQLARKFTCEIMVMPIPDVSDFRVEISDAEKQVFLDSMARVEKEALAECYSRLFSVVSKAAERLKDPEARFKESLIGNITELIDLLPRLNPIDDPTLNSLRAEVSQVINKVSAESVRASETTRSETAQKLSDIADKMEVFMGGAQ